MVTASAAALRDYPLYAAVHFAELAYLDDMRENATHSGTEWSRRRMRSITTFVRAEIRYESVKNTV